MKKITKKQANKIKFNVNGNGKHGRERSKISKIIADMKKGDLVIIEKSDFNRNLKEKTGTVIHRYARSVGCSVSVRTMENGKGFVVRKNN